MRGNQVLLMLAPVLVLACGDSARERYRDTSAVEQVPTQQYYPSDAAYQTQALPSPEYTAPAQAPTPYQAPAPVPAAPRVVARASTPAPRPEPIPEPVPRVVLSAGTTLFASPRADVCSSEQSVGSRITTYVTESSEGAAAGNITFEVVEASKAGGAHESPRLILVPVEYERDGRRYPLSADVLDVPTRERRLQGSGRRDARNAVVGAAVGAVAGQLLGRDTRSTVAGAAAGAAVGGAGSYATADRDVCVAVGARIGVSVRSSIVE